MAQGPRAERGGPWLVACCIPAVASREEKDLGSDSGGWVGNELPEEQARRHLAYQHVNRCGCFWGPGPAMGQKCGHPWTCPCRANTVLGVAQLSAPAPQPTLPPANQGRAQPRGRGWPCAQAVGFISYYL